MKLDSIWRRLVAFKDKLVEAYIRGMAEEQAERHPVPPPWTCALCGQCIERRCETCARQKVGIRSNGEQKERPN